MLEKLIRQSQEERRLAARIVETRNKKEEIKNRRVQAEEKYAAERFVFLLLYLLSNCAIDKKSLSPIWKETHNLEGMLEQNMS